LLIVERILGRFPRLGIRQFLITYCFRISIAGVLHIALNTSYGKWWDFGAFGGDEAAFWLFSERLVSAWKDGTILQEKALQFNNYFAWLQILGFVRFLGDQLGGETIFGSKMVLCMVSALVVPYVYGMGLLFFDSRIARTAAKIAFLFPDYWFYSSTLMRDVLVSGLTAIIFFQVYSIFIVRFSWGRLFIASVLNFGIIKFLRGDFTYVIVGLICLLVLIGETSKRIGFVKKVILMGGGFFLIWIFLAILVPDLYSFQALSKDRFLGTEILEYRMNTQRDAGIEEASEGSFGAKLLRVPFFIRWPLMTIQILLQPIPPWVGLHSQINMFPLKTFVSVFSAFIWYGFMFFFPVGLWKCLENQPRRTVWIWGAAIILALALGFATGAHPRWRLILVPFLLIVISVGVHHYKEHRVLFFGSILMILAGLEIYSILKYLVV
jgi:hypothetical protein